MAMIRSISVALLLTAIGGIVPVWAAGGPEEKAAKREDGIWKSAIPPHGMTGEFGNHDPIGLAAGAVIKTDCSLNWVDPDDHKVYCFNSATAVEYFKQWPKANIRRARASWEALRPTQ
jgi:predicted alpha/beta-hydrolase family hydrolase